MPLGRPARRRGVRVPHPNMLQRRLVIMVVVVALAVYGLWKTFEITQVKVSAPGRDAEISTEVTKILHDSVWQQNLLTLDEDRLVSDLQQTDHLVRSAEVKRSWPHTVALAVVPKQPSMGWESGNQRYLLDRDGTVIGVLSTASPLPVVTDGSNLPVKIGSQVVSTRFVTFVSDLVSALGGQGIGVRHLDVKDTTFDLTVTTDRSYKLIFDTSRPAQGEVGDLKSVLALLASQHKAPAQHIDLRIAGKAYYQ
jgi:hypothetical protein